MKAVRNTSIFGALLVVFMGYSAGCGSDDGEVGPWQGVGQNTGNKGGAAGTAGKGGSAGKGGTTTTEPTDPCGGIPAKGVCSGTGQVKYCSTPTGQSKSKVVTVDCKALEECKVVGGQAKCAAKAGLCTPGKSECADSQTGRVCGENGAWTTFACAQCTASALGATCSSASATETLTGTVTFETRFPNQEFTDWSTELYPLPAASVLVATMQFDSAKNEYTLFHSAIADDQGNFTVKKPANPGPKDVLALFAAYVEDNKYVFAVVEPDLPDGMHELVDTPKANRFWGWTAGLAGLGTSPLKLNVTEAQGSGALRVYDALRFSYLMSKLVTGKGGKSIAVWLRFNTAYDCGNCFADMPGSVLDEAFDSQIFISATQENQSYWSVPMECHELGHWAMAAYGVSPNEGGSHYTGCVTHPGMAWSEGWATWFSIASMGSSKYFTKQQGTFWHLDVGTRSSTSDWPRPTPSDGLLQNMYELEVSAMLWAMTDKGDGTASPLGLPSNKLFLDALQSSRMTESPFARGYTTHTWEVVENTCDVTNVQDTGQSSPMFADFLDALRCQGMSASKVDAATEPTEHYPYSSQNPICQ